MNPPAAPPTSTERKASTRAVTEGRATRGPTTSVLRGCGGRPRPDVRSGGRGGPSRWHGAGSVAGPGWVDLPIPGKVKQRRVAADPRGVGRPGPGDEMQTEEAQPELLLPPKRLGTLLAEARLAGGYSLVEAADSLGGGWSRSSCSRSRPVVARCSTRTWSCSPTCTASRPRRSSPTYAPGDRPGRGRARRRHTTGRARR